MNFLIPLLLENGAEPDILNDRGEKPSDLCIRNDNLSGIQLLLS